MKYWKRSIGRSLFALLLPALLVCAGTPLRAAAQMGEIRGTVRDAEGNPLLAADVQLRSAAGTALVQATAAGAQGEFRFLRVVPGSYRLIVERIGYWALDTAVVVAPAPLVVELVLRERVIDLPGVRVEAERTRTRFQETAGATVTGLRNDQLKILPGLAEADVLRAVEILPGVVSTSDYSSAYNVRGGSADQNLILLDGLPVYNPFHLGGLFSVFNADMIARADLLAGGFPAEFGERVSSVLTLESDAGPAGLHGDAAISLLATRLALGTSLPASALQRLGLRTAQGRISARRSYFDQLLKPAFDFPYHLTDVQAFAEATTPTGSRLTFTGYTGRDVLNLAGLDDFPLKVLWTWGNDVMGAGWTRGVGDGRTIESRIGVSRFATAISFPEFQDTEFRSEITELLARADYKALLRNTTRLQTGVQLNHLAYDNLAATGGTVFQHGRDDGWLMGAYAQAGWHMADWLIEAGARLDGWNASSTDLRLVAAPRLAVKRFIGGGESALKLAAGRYTQFVHSLRDEELPLGIDIWVTSGARAPIITSDQLQGGVEAFIGEEWQLSLEGFYRTFHGVTAMNVADDPNATTDDLLTGTGKSYGADVLVRREAGRIQPMLALSWLRARRTFPDPLSIEPVPRQMTYAPIFDRRLDADLTITADVGRAVQLGLRLNYGSGLPYTRPLGAYVYNSYTPLSGTRAPLAGTGGDSAIAAVYLGPRNGERYPAYHRLDVSARRRLVRSWGTITPYVDVLNLTNRRNVLFYFYQYDRSPATRSGVSMFPLLPSLGVEVKF